MKKKMIIMNYIIDIRKPATKNVRAFCGWFSLLLGFTFFLQFPMQTVAQKLDYLYGMECYLLNKKGYMSYLSDIAQDTTTEGKLKRYQDISNLFYEQSKNIDIEKSIEQVKNSKHLKQIGQKLHESSVRTFMILYKGGLEYLTKAHQQDWSKEIHNIHSTYGLEERYLQFLAMETNPDMWFTTIDNKERISEEFLTHLQNIVPVWQNVLAGESKWLKPLQIGYKESEAHYIIDESVLKKTYDSLLRNSPTHDARLQEDYELVLSMLERCISGECYFVMQSL
jgi:hypothetical protein